ncbi:hypothetical protein V6B14_12745 [Sporosarcina psychrophila]|uniref:ParM/StbA family protein n=1 Tax=Sporosarcina psychrophila TaxID=1476 RepID=UPI0030D3FF56
MSGLILGIDAGNNGAKVAGPYGLDISKTAICGWFERDIEETFGDDDTEFEICGRKGFAGSIAEEEDEYGGGSMFGDTKAHDDTKVRVLLAANRYIKKYCPQVNTLKIVVGQPIATHKDSEKKKIEDMLLYGHEFVVNGERVSYFIEEVRVAIEGGGAFWSRPEIGLVRILDIGSGTVNAVTTKDKKIINNSSSTFNFGAETIRNKSDMSGMARGIIQNTTKLKWHKDDFVLVCGGIADRVAMHLKNHFTNIEVLSPQFQYQDGITVAHPVYANAIGFYNIAKGVYR